MKLQCSCGAKYAFEATPEMLAHPVKFICPSCGLDASEFVNQLIRQEFAGQEVSPSSPAPAASTPPPPPPPAASAARLRVAVEAAPAAQPQATAPVSKFCPKHRERATEQCFVCHKPICPKCLEMFGYFCSPLCKGKAEAQGLDVPAFEGQRDVVEGQFWRKTGLIAGSIGFVVVLFFAAWIWYAWFGSVPHRYFAARFEDNDRGYYGHAQLVGKDQIVFLHGGTLARYDMKTGKPVWTQELITKQQIDDLIKKENELQAKMNEGMGYHSHSSAEDIERFAKQALQSELTLHVSGPNVWVEHGTNISCYDWANGNLVHQIALPELYGTLVENGGELELIGEESVTHVSLANGDSSVDLFGPTGRQTVILAQHDANGGLITPDGKSLDPKKVEAQVQNLNLPGKIALPALLANSQHEMQLEQALNEDLGKAMRAKGIKNQPKTNDFGLVSGPTGFVQFASRLLEEHTVTRSAMKAPTGKSIIDSGNVNAANEGQAINEQLNEMQRNFGGDTVTEDQSRYQVTVRLPDSTNSPDWSSEVVGPPQLQVLKTVNVIEAGKTIIVLDKSNKKLWQASLTYPVSEVPGGFFSSERSHFGDGPAAEHGDTLYIFDQAVLTCFDLATGNARWRLPSVGVVGLFFDDKDDVYVNTTTGNPDDIKYSRQIDITRQTEAVVSKIDGKTGKTLWTAKPGGFVSYVSGQFLYVIDCYDPNPTDEDQMDDTIASLQKPAFLRITRVRPSDGRVMWDYYDRDRCPVDWSFNNNSIQLIFKREVQVLRYLTL